MEALVAVNNTAYEEDHNVPSNSSALDPTDNIPPVGVESLGRAQHSNFEALDLLDYYEDVACGCSDYLLTTKKRERYFLRCPPKGFYKCHVGDWIQNCSCYLE
mmetsp:Transcript_35283/g.81721  ORF Transcript_35283/g.81721 Transcript_35283/m.81721 type:complete len:103 (+) Transcript_35283:1535-1843(+)